MNGNNTHNPKLATSTDMPFSLASAARPQKKPMAPNHNKLQRNVFFGLGPLLIRTLTVKVQPAL
jgi:hypothetical protein